MSLDEVDSSNPNLTAVHAGASTRKTGHLQPNASNAADAEGELFCLFRLASHIRVLSKSVEKPALHSKTTISPEVSGYSRTKVQGCPHGSPYEAADSAVHRGDRGALIEGTPNCRLPASPNHPRGFSPRFYHSFREACGSSQRQPSCTSGLSCFLDRRRSAIQPLSGWLIGALVPTARLHSTHPVQADRQDLHLRSSSTSACACAFRT